VNKRSVALRRSGLAAAATTLAMAACVAGAGAASADASFDLTRVSGADRYETSAKTAATYGAADTVILASGEEGHYADALAASYLSGLRDAPVLLTKKTATPGPVAKQIADSGAERVIIVGGEGAVSAAQADELAKSYKVTRISGENRFDTAAKLIAAGDEAPGNTALLATGQDFPDALGAGPVSYAEQMPLAITKESDIPDDVVDALKQAGIRRVVVLGGEGAIAKSVVEELDAKGITLVERIAGADRAETSAKVAAYAVKNYGFSTAAVNVASGYAKGDGADALSGAALSGQQERALLITRSQKKAGEGVLSFLDEHKGSLTEGLVFGGDAAVSDETVVELEKAVIGSGAQNLTTGELYDDVQAALLEAKAGDTVEVFDGGEGDALSGFAITTDDVTIQGEDGAQVDGTIAITGATGVTVSGLSITPGTVANQGAGFFLTDVDDVTISDNVVDAASGSTAAGVINATGGQDEVATISGNTFRDLRQGVFANLSADFTIDGNTFENNVAGSANDAASTITDNTFRNNDEGVGLGVAGSTVTGNSFANSATDHVGDYTADSAYDLNALVEDNTFDEDVVVTPAEDAATGPEFIKDADQVG
jgi:putative cell wall-binding protein